MSAPNGRSLAESLLPFVQAAGQAEMEVFARNFQVYLKSDETPVTEADERAEAILLEGLAQIEPDLPVIAEEAFSQGHCPIIAERFFLVDPLDGTKEFVRKSDEFTVNVALIENGEPVFGMIYAPATQRLFFTLTRDQAFTARMPLEPRCEKLDTLDLFPLGVQPQAAGGYRVLASLSHMTEETRHYIDQFLVAEMMCAGSSLKFCLLAMGEADFYPRFSRTSEWDVAAGHAILKAAGGDVLTLDGMPLSYGKQVAGFANPGFVATATGQLPTA